MLDEALATLDSLLSEIEGADACEDPDQFGYFDRLEWVAGLGFTACQTYITETRSWFGTERASLSWGPRYGRGDHTIAQVVNAAANYWKHQAEWDWSTEDTRRQRTVDVLSAVLGEEITGSVSGHPGARISGPA
jgi:hypothetical protein